MKILVTGGAGFIGSNFIRYILMHHPEDEVVNLDALTYAGHLENLTEVANNERYHFVKGNITDKNMLENLFETEKFDVVINFAAESHVDRSVLEPQIFILTNVVGTQMLLEACKKYKVKRFHQVSTDEVYGDLPLEAKELLFTELNPINPSSPYSASKASADLLVAAYYRTFDLPITISRCSNNYGPYHLPEKLIPRTFVKAINEETIPVYGNGLNIRDWLYVTDHCSAIDAIIRKGKVGEIYNIGGNSERTNLEVVSTLLKTLQKPQSLITFVKDRPGHDLRYAIDATKIKVELGWEPTYTFEQGIEQTVSWYLANENWWKAMMQYSNY